MNRPCVAILLGAGLGACAARAPKPIALVAPLDTLAFYVGTWSCKGTSFVSADQPTEERWAATVKVAPELDGTWLSVQMIGPEMNRTAEHKGFDPTTKTWVHVAVGTGGSWGVMTSPGWTGAQMVLTPADKTDTTHATFTKLDETRYSHAVADASGHKVWEKVCTKA